MKPSLTKISTTLAIFMIASASLSSPSSARTLDDVFPAAGKAATAVIENCHLLEQDNLDSGNTARMRAGAIGTAVCIREHILEISSDTLFPHDAETLNKVEVSLKQIWEGTGKLYWSLHNDNVACEPSCGSMFHLSHASKLIDVMSDTLRSFYWKLASEDLKDFDRN